RLARPGRAERGDDRRRSHRAGNRLPLRDRARADAQGPQRAFCRRSLWWLPGDHEEPARRLDRCQRIAQGRPGSGILNGRRRVIVATVCCGTRTAGTRSMTRTLLLATLLCVAPALQAQSWQDANDAEEAAWQEQQAAASQAYQLRVAEALSASGEPREQAFAELLRRQSTAADAGTVPAGDLPSRAAPRDPALESRLHAIAARAGDDQLANQLLIAVDRDTGSPLRRAAAQRWQAAEPDNLAALLQVGPPVDDLLAQARNTTHASTHMYDAVRWMSAAFQRHPLTPAELAALSGDAP